MAVRVILDPKSLHPFRQNGKENLAECVGDGNQAKFGWIVSHTLHLFRQYNKNDRPVSRDVLVTEDPHEDLGPCRGSPRMFCR